MRIIFIMLIMIFMSGCVIKIEKRYIVKNEKCRQIPNHLLVDDIYDNNISGDLYQILDKLKIMVIKYRMRIKEIKRYEENIRCY